MDLDFNLEETLVNLERKLKTILNEPKPNKRFLSKPQMDYEDIARMPNVPMPKNPFEPKIFDLPDPNYPEIPPLKNTI